MTLANYQNEIVSRIYDILVNSENDCGITLYGDAGSGKTTIALSAIEMLQEDWTIFFIDGISPDLSPYLTWHVGMNLYSKKKLCLSREVSFGINFLPIPISLELGNTSIDKSNYVLSQSEEALLTGINKQAGTNSNILFVADNYELWDIPSVQFLQKLIMPSLNLLPNYRVFVLLIGNKKEFIDVKMHWDYISIPPLSEEDVLAVLHNHNHTSKTDIETIRICAGNDLSLALMAAEYYEHDGEFCTDFNEIMDKRCSALLLDERDACMALEPLSIIDSLFTKDEVAFFLEPNGMSELEKEYQAEEYLSIAESKCFIVGTESYSFSNNKIREYFNARLSRKRRLCHRKFANYLKEFRPEDYYYRGKHLEMGLLSNDPQRICQIWQLLFLSYIRRASETNSLDDVYNIFENINELIDRLPANLLDSQKRIWEEMILGYEKFSNYKYRDALYHLQSLPASQLTDTCLAEIQRIVLLCHIQLAESLIDIVRFAEDLYATIEDVDFNEDEQYCRAALVLLDVYIDRTNDEAKVMHLQRKLHQLIRKHSSQSVFQEFEACYNRKAALYFAAQIACRQTEQSINFYKKHYDVRGLYMSLCNHAGNAIIAGDYRMAELSLIECEKILDSNKERYFPSRYKVENNKIVLEYLQAEMRSSNDPDIIITAARKAIEKLKLLLYNQENETSHVIRLNIVAFLMLVQSDECLEALKSASEQVSESDAYYQYYIHDLKFAYAFLNNDTSTARNELSCMKAMCVPLLQMYNRIFTVRRCKQESLLDKQEEIDGDALKYHIAISSACEHIQDNSHVFYGRGFLLSDLQFLSY